MNKKQRLRNRRTAQQLHRKVSRCPECGESLEHDGGHWFTTRHVTLEDIMTAHKAGVPIREENHGFWTCAKFYETNPDGTPGRRKQEHIDRRYTAEGMFDLALSMLATGMLPPGKPEQSQTVKNSEPNGLFQEIQVNIDPEIEAVAQEIAREGAALSPEAKALVESMREHLLRIAHSESNDYDKPFVNTFPIISDEQARRLHDSPAFRALIAKPMPGLLSVAGETDHSHSPSDEKFGDDFLFNLPGITASDLSPLLTRTRSG